ncbi:hypothetical protein CLAIMM_14316 [Cladophialophora immunda]|nr:hypothetical protein CLAIMM_14316 [Cladophialophora immunda]
MFTTKTTSIGRSRVSGGASTVSLLQINLNPEAGLLIPKSARWNRFNIINEVTRQDPRFTVNMEAKYGVTFKEGDEVYTLDLMDDEAAMCLPEGTLLEEAVQLETTPLPYVVEAIKLKLFAARRLPHPHQGDQGPPR